MERARRILIAIAVAVAMLTAATALAGNVERHSGSVISADPATGTIVLAEVGPWKVEDGRTVLTEVHILVTRETELVFVQRRDDREIAT